MEQGEPHYVALPPHTDNPAEPIRYDCSLCDKDVYNLSMHAQFEHGSRTFTIDHTETPRETGVVGHPCGVKGCSFDGNHEGRHSWEPEDPSQGITRSATSAIDKEEEVADSAGN